MDVVVVIVLITFNISSGLTRVDFFLIHTPRVKNMQQNLVISVYEPG